MPKKAAKHIHLRHAFHPSRYKLTIKPNLKNFSFEGEEVIYFNLKKSEKKFTLHARDLDIQSVSYINTNGEKIKGTVKYDLEKETVTLSFRKTVPKGEGEFHIEYKGTISETLKGFYRSRYYANDEERWMATTQFESTDARQAFLCVDEPAAKAIFDITLIIPSHTKAISNTFETEVTEHESGYKVVKFAPTPKMSTYLVAFLVGEFESVETKTKEGTLVRIFTTPGKKHQAQFALEVGSKIISFYNKYFGIPYPLPILDMIALPDFSAGAMENWGAVTYRETALLIDPDHSAAEARQRVALVIAHELAHQWFGNLVTMEWWTDLWLNEGFASYIEYLAVDHLFPEWKIWNQFMVSEVDRALELDSLNNTHAIEIEVDHPDEIREIFDAVSYAKGASVIRMLAEYLGEKDFRSGLNHYLKKFSYGNAKTKDLWEALEKASGKPVRKVMELWTRQPGYPLISIAKTAKGLAFKQERYYSSSLAKKSSKETWLIPAKIQTEKNKKVNQIQISKRHQTFNNAVGEWAKINVGETSFFRTKYPKDFLKSFYAKIVNKEFGELDRLGIIRDAFALAESGDSSSVDALNLVRAYAQEDSLVVWLDIAGGLGKISALIDDQKYFDSYKQYGLKVFAPLAKRMGWNKKKGDGHNEALLRSASLSMAGYFGDPAVISKAKELFNQIFTKQKDIHPDIRSVVYRVTAYNGNKKEFDLLLSRYKKEHLHEEKNRIARALCSFPSQSLVQKALQFSLSKEVRAQDIMLFIAYSMSNPHGREITWKFIQKNWDKFVDLFGGDYILAHIVETLGVFKTHEKAIEVKRFFNKRQAPAAARTLKQVLEQIEANAAWLKREEKLLKEFLRENI